MKIIDCFPYYNEKELLQLRYNLLKDVVDEFIICEGDVTHTGDPKTMTCIDTLNELGIPLNKIKLIKVKLPSDKGLSNWRRENAQRDAARSFLNDNNTVAIVSDCDEIMNPASVKYYAESALMYPDRIIRIPMAYLNCRADLQVMDKQGNSRDWNAPFMCLRKHVEKYSLSQIRESYTRGKNDISFSDTYLVDNGVIEKAGWHFSWMGNAERMQNKIKSLADHGDFIAGAAGGGSDKTKIIDFMDSYKAKDGSTDPLGREDHVLKYYPISKLPQKIFELPLVQDYLLPAKIKHFYNETQFGENWFTFPELYSEMVRKFPDGSKFVEIGSWKGRSAAYMATEIVNNDKQIEFTCVDTWQGSIEHQEANKDELKDLYHIFIKNMSPVDGKYTPLRLTSLQAAEQFADNTLDFIFIDASHEYEDVKNDIKAWLPKLKKTGVIAGHDCYPDNPEFGGVYKAVKELIPNFKISENCWIYEPMNPIKSEIENLLYKFIDNPNDAESNFALALYYDRLNQTASAVSYYIRTAERAPDPLLQYEALVKAALCFLRQGTRGLSVRGLLQRAITVLPKRPEAYFLLARWWERDNTVEGWVNCYTLSTIGENHCDFNLAPLRTNVEYPGKYGMIFEKAISAWWVGLCEESRDLLKILLTQYKLDATHKNAAINNLKFMKQNVDQYL